MSGGTVEGSLLGRVAAQMEGRDFALAVHRCVSGFQVTLVFTKRADATTQMRGVVCASGGSLSNALTCILADLASGLTEE